MRINRLLIVPKLDKLEEYSNLAKAYNCGFEYNDFFLPEVLDDSQGLERRVESYLSSNMLPEYTTLHGAFLDVNIASSDKEIFNVSDKRIRQSMEVASKLGVTAVVFHTNYIANFLQESYRESWVASNVVYWKEILKEYPNINIYIENMFDMDWELLLKLGQAMKDEPNFGICLDYAHAGVFGDETKVAEWVVELAPYVKHIHINDNDFVSDLHQALGDGNIDWHYFKELYNTYLNKASVLIEVSDIEKTKKSLEFLRNI